MIILFPIIFVSVAFCYTIPGCGPKMTPVNATHCRIEYEHCLTDVKPDHIASLKFLFTDGRFTSKVSENNLVNIKSVCANFSHIALHLNGEPVLLFNYTSDNFKETIQDFMCYSDNQVTINMEHFRKERPDQSCLNTVKIRDVMIEDFKQVKDGVLTVSVDEVFEMKLIRGLNKNRKPINLRLNKTYLTKCTDKDLIFNIIVGGSITLVFVICAVFLIYCFSTIKRINASAEIDKNQEYDNIDYYTESKVTDNNSYYNSFEVEDVSYAREKNPEYNRRGK